MTVSRRAAIGLILAAIWTSNGAAAPFDVRWDTRLGSAAARSQETGRPILIEFWATWCEACKGMDEEVYSDPAVARAMAKTLPVRIDIDREPAIARRYAVSATPTLILVDAAGNELFRFTGRIERAPLIELLRELPPDITRINRLASTLAGDRSSVSTLDALGRELGQASFYVASNRYYERAIDTDAARRDKTVRGRLLASIGRNYSALKRPAEAANAFERALRDLRGRPGESAVMLDLARARIAGGQSKEARATLEDLQQRFAGTPAAADAGKLAATLQGR